MVMLRDTNPDLYNQDISKIFYKELAKKEEMYSKVYNVLTTENKYEKMSGVTGLGILSEKTEGNEYTADEILQLYDKTFTPTTYGGIVRATREAVEDDRTGKLMMIPKMFGNSMRATIETTAAAIFDNSQTTTGADAKVLCATDHPINPNSTSTYSNRPTNNADLSLTVLEDAYTAMATTVNARNITDGLTPKYLLVAPANKINGEKILGSRQVAGSGDNDKNVIGTYGIQLVVNPYITDTDSWYLIAEKDNHQLIFLWRKRPSMSTDTDTLTDDALYKARGRFTVGWVDARGIYGSVGG